MPEQDDFSLCMLNNARKAARALSRRYDAFVRHLGLKATQFNALILVRDHPGKTTAELADLAVLERTTLVRNLALLQRMELIESGTRTTGTGKAHRLTRKGMALLDEALPLWRKAQAEVKDELGEQAFLDTIRALQTLTKL